MQDKQGSLWPDSLRICCTCR